GLGDFVILVVVMHQRGAFRLLTAGTVGLQIRSGRAVGVGVDRTGRLAGKVAVVQVIHVVTRCGVPADRATGLRRGGGGRRGPVQPVVVAGVAEQVGKQFAEVDEGL